MYLKITERLRQLLLQFVVTLCLISFLNCQGSSGLDSQHFISASSAGTDEGSWLQQQVKKISNQYGLKDDSQSGPQGGSRYAEKVGINIFDNGFWTTVIDRADAMEKASEWTPYDFINWRLDPNGSFPGYTSTGVPLLGPNQGAYSLVFRGPGKGNYPQGDYCLSYDGSGEIEVGYDGVDLGPLFQGNPNKRKIRVTKEKQSGDGIYVLVKSSAASNPVTNVKLILPGHYDAACNQTSKINTDFLVRWGVLGEFPLHNSVKGSGILRLMDYFHEGSNSSSESGANANGSHCSKKPQRACAVNHDTGWGTPHCDEKIDENTTLYHGPCILEWADRVQPNKSNYGDGKGSPYESGIELVNAMKVNPWIVIPFAATPDYMEKMAQLWCQRVIPELKIYLEYSNEVWNGGFNQHHFALQSGKDLRLHSDGWVAGIYYHARQSELAFDIFDRVCGRERVVHILAGHMANPSYGQNLLDYNQINNKTDYYVVANYIGNSFGEPQNQQRTLNMTQEQIIAELFNEIDTGMRQGIRDNIRVTQFTRNANWQEVPRQGYHPPTGTYEGGMHMVAYGDGQNNQSLIDHMSRVNKHPLMLILINYHMQVSRDGGLAIQVPFGSSALGSKFGYWGYLDSDSQNPYDPANRAYKYLGLIWFLSKNL